MTTTTNNENKNTGLTNYAAAVNWLHGGLVMCNKLPEIDPSIWNNMRKPLEDEETGEYTDIYQWFITSWSEWDVEWLEKTFPDLIISYSDLLDCYVLCVDHFGTGWDYVMITCTNPVCERGEGEKI